MTKPTTEEKKVTKGRPKKQKATTVNETAVKEVNFLDKISGISIRPYIEENYQNMGLEDYGMVLFPGTSQEEQLAAIERNGQVRYITGLDEFAPEVQNIKNPEKREAIIRKIRQVVSILEKQFKSNVIDPDDPEFWNKVEQLKPNNEKFFSEISVRCGNEPTYLKPKEDPFDLIRFMAIEAGGFPLVAKSYEDAQAMAKAPKWYLDKEEDTVSTRTEYKKLRNKAIGVLDDLYSKNPTKLLYVTKILETHSARYKKSTPIDVLYETLDEYIAGNSNEPKKGAAAQALINTGQQDMETLKLRAIVKDASFYKFITLKPDGMLYHTKKNNMLGRNISDVVEFLKNPMNEDVLADLLSEVEEYWI